MGQRTLRLTETADGRLVGRGASDDKGPALSWLWVVRSAPQAQHEAPRAPQIAYEGMEEFGSEGLPEFVAKGCRRSRGLMMLSGNHAGLQERGLAVGRGPLCDFGQPWLAKKTPPDLWSSRRRVLRGHRSGPAQDLHSVVRAGRSMNR